MNRIKAVAAVAVLLITSVIPSAGMNLSAEGDGTDLSSARILAVSALVRYGYFSASEQAFRDIYGHAAPLGLELRLGRKRISGWLEGGFLSRKGRFSFTNDETRVRIQAYEGGALYRILSGRLSPYAGAGLGIYVYKETNFLGTARQSKLGFCLISGAEIVLMKSLILDLKMKYSRCVIQPADFKVDIGGWTMGAGLGLRF
jgi:opacity protein-like surface antigen